MPNPQPFTPTALLCDHRFVSFRAREFRQAPHLRIPTHEHLEPTIVVIVAGEVVDTYGSRRETIGANSLLTRPAREPHTHDYGRLGAHCIAFSVTPAGSLTLRIADHVTVRPVRASAFRDELHAEDAMREVTLEQLLLEAIESGENREQSRPRWLDRVIERIRDTRDSPALAEIATIANVHPGHLTRAFRAHVGSTIGEYIRKVRVLESATRLERDDDDIATIALDAGFFDQSHFTRVFRRIVGVTPGEWRRRATMRIPYKTKGDTSLRIPK